MENIFGDLFEHIPDKESGISVIIPHVVNDIGAWGAGFVVPLAKHFPRSLKIYRRMHEKNALALGKCQFIQTGHVYVANMVAQHKLKSADNPHPIRYDALTTCMTMLRDYLLHSDLENIEIHCPKFGSLRSGGDWNRIERMIEEIWFKHFPVTIYSFEEK